MFLASQAISRLLTQTSLASEYKRATEFPKHRCATMSAILAAIQKCFAKGVIDFAAGGWGREVYLLKPSQNESKLKLVCGRPHLEAQTRIRWLSSSVICKLLPSQRKKIGQFLKASDITMAGRRPQSKICFTMLFPLLTTVGD